jgi:hypothetical protein
MFCQVIPAIFIENTTEICNSLLGKNSINN